MVAFRAAHPEVAYRSCRSCRKYQYDEKNGEMYVGKDGEPVPRNGKTPCEGRLGCAKGTWWQPKIEDLRSSEEFFINLFHASKASGGAVLNDDERSSDAVAFLFGQLDRIFQAKASGGLARAITTGLIATKGL